MSLTAAAPDYQLEASNALAVFGPLQLAGHLQRQADKLRTEFDASAGDPLAANVYAGGLDYVLRYAIAIVDLLGPMVPKAPERMR